MNEIVGFSEELPGDPDQGDPARGDGRSQEHELHRRQARLSHFFPVLRIRDEQSGSYFIEFRNLFMGKNST
jgi:hypothetical protein